MHLLIVFFVSLKTYLLTMIISIVQEPSFLTFKWVLPISFPRWFIWTFRSSNIIASLVNDFSPGSLAFIPAPNKAWTTCCVRLYSSISNRNSVWFLLINNSSANICSKYSRHSSVFFSKCVRRVFHLKEFHYTYI